MKFNFKNVFAIALAATMSFAFTACDDDDDNSDNSLSAEELTMQAINAHYVNTVVIDTYSKLADACESLETKINALTADQSAANIEAACDQWKVARQYWEWSEAFLFGAAANYSIDPHIDTWPFDQAAFDNLMAKFSDNLSEADQANINEVVANTQTLTGFHALEYVIFAEGEPKDATNLSQKECYFLNAVAADLYLSSVRLEAAWAGIDNVSSARQTLLADAELEPTDDFGAEFKGAGFAGSRWATVTLATVEIIQGCQDIIDEVASAKIGSAANGEDINYIESPYAYNSIQDFEDNVWGCVNAICGIAPGTSNDVDAIATLGAASSVMAFGLVKAPTETAQVAATAAAAITAVRNMKKPFVLNYSDPSAQTAIAALEAFDGALDDLKEAIQK